MLKLTHYDNIILVYTVHVKPKFDNSLKIVNYDGNRAGRAGAAVRAKVAAPHCAGAAYTV